MVQVISVLVFLQSIATASAFAIHRKTMVGRASKPKLYYHPETFDRAVDCANNYDLCNVDELLNLAQGSFRTNGFFA